MAADTSSSASWIDPLIVSLDEIKIKQTETFQDARCQLDALFEVLSKAENSLKGKPLKSSPIASSAPPIDAQSVLKNVSAFANVSCPHAPGKAFRELFSSISKVGKAVDKNLPSTIEAAHKPGLLDVQLLDELVANQLLRDGRFPSAQTLIKESSLNRSTMEEAQSHFVEMHSILFALRRRDVEPALAWVGKCEIRVRDARQDYEKLLKEREEKELANRSNSSTSSSKTVDEAATPAVSARSVRVGSASSSSPSPSELVAAISRESAASVPLAWPPPIPPRSLPATSANSSQSSTAFSPTLPMLLRSWLHSSPRTMLYSSLASSSSSPPTSGPSTATTNAPSSSQSASQRAAAPPQPLPPPLAAPNAVLALSELRFVLHRLRFLQLLFPSLCTLEPSPSSGALPTSAVEVQAADGSSASASSSSGLSYTGAPISANSSAIGVRHSLVPPLPAPSTKRQKTLSPSISPLAAVSSPNPNHHLQLDERAVGPMQLDGLSAVDASNTVATAPAAVSASASAFASPPTAAPMLEPLAALSTLTSSSLSSPSSSGSLRPSSTAAALKYAQTHFPSFASSKLKEIQKLAACLLFANNLAALQASPYAELVRSGAWLEAEQDFCSIYCKLMGLPERSPLSSSVAAGIIALPKMLKFVSVMKGKNEFKEFTHGHHLPVEIDLGKKHQYHSTFVCPVSKEITTSDNHPVLLLCGHVIAKDSMMKIVRSSRLGRTKFKCPTCPQEQAPHEVMEIHF